MALVAEETYETTDPDLSSQMTNLSRSPADTFFLIATGKFPVQAISKKGELGWNPLMLMHSPLSNIETVFKPGGVEASTGAMGVKYFKESGDPQWEGDPAMQEYEAKTAQYGENIDVLDVNNVWAWALSEALVKVLEQTPEPTREALLETVRSLDGLEVGMLYPGVSMSTSDTDGFVIEQGQLTRFTGTGFENIGGIVDKEGQTPIEDVPGVG
jgi:branched-chain amino acid transport system substrate-binding protein